MKTLDPGQVYELDHLDGTGKTVLRFVARPPFHEPVEGVLNQEVLRALIDRVEILDKETPWTGNVEILYHLRMALVLHEARALIRKTHKNELLPEKIPIGPDGHFILELK